MFKKLIPIINITLVVFCAGFLAANFIAIPAWGSDPSTDQATITLDVINEPLGSVLAKITKRSRWKIIAPDTWLDRPVTQALNKATLEDGLRSVLNSAGVGNLLLLYDEKTRVVTIFDTETALRQAANRPPSPANQQRPVLSVTGVPDPILQRAAERDAKPAPVRRNNRRTRRQSSDDD